MSYTYDNDSRVTGITYKFNATTLGNLTYTYDSLGRRAQVGGSFAQTALPGTVASATYDAANELTNWNGTTISYDMNGNMLSDGTNTLSWNARNQVATLNSVSLQYDGFGRRTKNLQNTSFLFDGANAVQELSGSTPTANLISGGIDEIFTRADSTGTFTPLKDALGSTIALVNASGDLVTQYAYDPFGNTTVSGATSSNSFQYTGRENEGNGLYFYRAPYYSSVLGRFINEDPAGEGQNFYAYADDDPIQFSDPLGLWPWGNTAPANIPNTGTNGGLQLIQGGAGRFLPRGAGQWGLAGFLFVLDAGLAYEDYQAIQDFNAENAAYGAEWQSVIAYNQAVLAHPRPLPLAGRYTSPQRRQFEYERARDACNAAVAESGNRCADLSRLIDHAKRCISLYQDWDDKWDQGNHAKKIATWQTRLGNLKDEHNDNCTDK